MEKWGDMTASKLAHTEVMERNGDADGEEKSHKCSPMYHVLSGRRVNWKLNIVKVATYLHYEDVCAELSGLLR